MTISLVTIIQRWIGLSTDTKPTTDVKEGSTFYETNTGQGWMWDGSNWVEDLTLIYAFTEALKEWEPETSGIGTIIGDGRKIVTTAGTAVQLSSTSVQVSRVSIQSELNNTGVIAVGDSTVVATVLTTRGIALYAGDSITLEIVDLSLIYLDATVSGDGVTYLWSKE